MINGIKIVDTHCHVFPSKIAEKAVKGTDNFYKTISYGTGTFDNLIKSHDMGNIDYGVIHSVATTPKQVESINNFIADCEKNSNGRFWGLGALHPDSIDIEKDINDLLKLNLHGIKIHPDIQNFKVDDKKCYKMYELCSFYNLPILMHTGDNRYDNSNPNRLVNVLKEFKKLQIIGAHFGGWSIWQEAYKELYKFDNLVVDCSSSFYYMTKEETTKVITKYGIDKVMFATDYPMWCPKDELDYFLSLKFSSNDYEKMLYKNAKRIFNMNI